MQLIPGPDFPTGGKIYGKEGIKATYSTGKGKIVVRGEAEIEESGKNQRIVISSLPFQVNKADLIAKIADLVKSKKIEGITGLRDESDRKEGVRIIVDLKANSYPKKILNQLYDMTALQSAFHANLLALEKGIQPKVFTLDQLLLEFIQHRQIVIRRRTEFLLKRAQDREHILEGLKIALDSIDEIIAVIKKSPNKEEAQKALMAGFNLSERQATAILDMRLSQLSALERQKIEDELKEVKAMIEEYKSILSDEQKILSLIKKETLEIKENYGDKRKTKILAQELGNFSAEDLCPMRMF